MAGRTAFAKIWDAHRLVELGDGTDLILIDRTLLHERTGGIALQSLMAAGRRVANPEHVFATMDHIVDTLPGRGDRTMMPTGTQFITSTRAAARAAGITLYDLGDPRQGILHVISPELGIMLPGLTLVCPDSHTCSQGALGGLAWGIGSTEAEHALVTNCLRVQRPKTMRITIAGRLTAGVTSKDLALHLLGRFGSSGALGHAIEFAGEAVRALDVEERLTLCNMSTELAAFTGFISADERVFDFLAGRPFAPSDETWDRAVGHWKLLATDADATFHSELAVDSAEVAPMITWGTSPQQVVGLDCPVPEFKEVAVLNTREAYDRALNYMDVAAGQPLIGLPIDGAFIGSCTNSRLSDLRRAANVLRGRKVAPGVKAICVPGSSLVKASAEAEGLHHAFIAAGFEWREAGCSMCFYAGGESFGLRHRVVSSTNRNFESRQGPETRTHLASPETVAASSIAGAIADPRRLQSHL